MTVRIAYVEGESVFFCPGDEIVSIDGFKVADQLDLLFHQGQKSSAVYSVRRSDGRIVSRRLSSASFNRSRLGFEEMSFKRCGSRCIFCFVDQMPPGLRASLYEKDDDFRLSFLFGNYVTLNNVSDRELRRIIDQRLSPLYISVHAVDRALRERIFGVPQRRDILDTMRRLARGDIGMHTQIVLMPGVNDGHALDRTVDAMFELYPSCRSVAVVPVGLTAHREGLPELRSVTARESRSLIEWARSRRKEFLSLTGGEFFLHLADEFYLIAGRELPPFDSYDDFPQISNGIGMCRMFIEAVKGDLKRLGSGTSAGGSMTVVTGALGGRMLRRYVLPLIAESQPDLCIELLVVRNSTFGAKVTVSGLMAGADIVSAARRKGAGSGCLVIPPNALNHQGLLIDDMKPGDISKALGVPVVTARSTFLERTVLRKCRKV
jgi:putative radical SAM enzyme (TIGR03279 family)